MAALPGQLLAGFQGRRAELPQRRPTMSAKPSPPHMSEMATRPTCTAHLQNLHIGARANPQGLAALPHKSEVATRLS